MNYGLVLKPIQSDHYVLGSAASLPKDILQPTRQWNESLPVYEPQADKYETWGCPVWGTQNGYETLFKKKFGREINADERYNYNCINLDYPGGDPHEACESIRNDGLTFGVWAMPDTFDEFKTVRPMTDELKKEGRKWPYKFNHEWVSTDVNSIKEALLYSPVCVSVTAWYQDENGLYIDNGEPNNHWCMIYGFYEQDGKTYWKIFDSYDHSTKVLHPSHKMSVAKRFYITKREDGIIQVSFWQKLISLIKRIWDIK